MVEWVDQVDRIEGPRLSKTRPNTRTYDGRPMRAAAYLVRTEAAEECAVNPDTSSMSWFLAPYAVLVAL